MALFCRSRGGRLLRIRGVGLRQHNGGSVWRSRLCGIRVGRTRLQVSAVSILAAGARKSRWFRVALLSERLKKVISTARGRNRRRLAFRPHCCGRLLRGILAPAKGPPRFSKICGVVRHNSSS